MTAIELPPVVELAGITKAYPGVVANDSVNLLLHGGEVHVVLGENGAGKSTLIGVLSGMVTPDSGRILVDGEPVQIRSPKDALDLGIGTVYQHSLLVPTLSVIDNMMLGTAKLFSLDREQARRRLDELASVLGVQIDPEATVGDLALGERQQVEIVKALWRGERALILDEPTSMLTPQGVQALSEVVRRLVGNGLSVVFITHKLNEALDLGDRITVLRRGRNAGELAPDKIASTERGDLKDLVVELIFGAVDPDMSMNQGEGGSLDQQSVCFRLEEVSLHGDKPWPVLDSVSLEIRRGEIFGIAGIDGNGQKELAEVIAGQRKLDSGEIFLDEESVTGLSVAARQKRGIRYVTDDRHGEGTVSALSISLNTVLKRVGQRPFWRRARVRHSLIREFAATLVAEHDVRTPHEEVPIANLSGGNVQKVVVGRELAMEPRVVVYNKPTYGLDVKTIKAVLARIVSQANQGTVALLISTELDELISTCDRIGVMYQGRITGILDSQPGIETRLGELMTGGGEPA